MSHSLPFLRLHLWFQPLPSDPHFHLIHRHYPPVHVDTLLKPIQQQGKSISLDLLKICSKNAGCGLKDSYLVLCVAQGVETHEKSDIPAQPQTVFLC